MASQNSDAIITIDDTPYEDIDLSKDERHKELLLFPVPQRKLRS
jgi:hypothetical protein